MTALTLMIAALATIAIFLTTARGREVAKRVGLRDHVPGAARSEDLEYLLSACGGDSAERDRRMAFERERLPALTEAEHCRRAIRRVFAERERTREHEEEGPEEAEHARDRPTR